MLTTATVETLHGAAYTRRLVKHFAHKIHAVANDNGGRIDFPFGVCEIECDDQQMRISINVVDADDVERAERVVSDHLVRMANKDEPVVTWTRQSD